MIHGKSCLYSPQNIGTVQGPASPALAGIPLVTYEFDALHLVASQ